MSTWIIQTTIITYKNPFNTQKYQTYKISFLKLNHSNDKKKQKLPIFSTIFFLKTNVIKGTPFKEVFIFHLKY